MDLEISGLRVRGGGVGIDKRPQTQLRETVHTPSDYLMFASAQDWHRVVGMGY